MYKERARPFAMDGGQSTRVLFQPWMVDGESVLWYSGALITIGGQSTRVLFQPSLDRERKFGFLICN